MFDGLGGRQLVSLGHRLERTVLVADGELQAPPPGRIEQQGRAAVDHRIVVDVLAAVPVGDHAIDPGDPHQQRVVLQHVGVGGIIGADQRVIVRGDVSPPRRICPLRVEAAHRPVPAPGTADRLRLEPGHVMHEELRSNLRSPDVLGSGFRVGEAEGQYQAQVRHQFKEQGAGRSHRRSHSTSSHSSASRSETSRIRPSRSQSRSICTGIAAAPHLAPAMAPTRTGQ